MTSTKKEYREQDELSGKQFIDLILQNKNFQTSLEKYFNSMKSQESKHTVKILNERLSSLSRKRSVAEHEIELLQQRIYEIQTVTIPELVNKTEIVNFFKKRKLNR